MAGCLAFVLIPAALKARVVVPIQKALDKRYVTASAVCTGGLNLHYTLINQLKDSVYVDVPAGWRFVSMATGTDYQDILLTHNEQLALRGGETRRFTLSGFCCEASRSGPVAGVPYSNGQLADSNLLRLARHLNTVPTDRNTQQYAVWAISDGYETANITHRSDSLAAPLRSFVAGLKGEALPWYTLLKKAVITSQGAVNDYPLRFNASVPFQVSRTCYSFCYMVDENGNTVSEIFGAWLDPRQNTYSASFSVAGLKKGEYRLILESKEENLFRRSFKI